MSISGKMSTGMRSAAPIPIKLMRINIATTVYGRFSAASTIDIAPLPAREYRQLRSRIGVELFHDAADVVLDGAFRQGHGIGDLPVAHAFGDQTQDLLFFVGELFGGGVAARRAPPRQMAVVLRQTSELIHDLAGNLRRQPRFAAPQRANG